MPPWVRPRSYSRPPAQPRQIHQPLLLQLDQALKDLSPGVSAERLRRERDVCELHQLALDLAWYQFEGQYLGWHYFGGGTKKDGLRAADLLVKGGVLADKIIAWSGYDPEEPKSYLPGWKSYWESYRKVFTDLDKRVREKFSQER